MDKIKKNFGFGCMRFPMIGEEVDEKQVCQMVDYFLEQGNITSWVRHIATAAQYRHRPSPNRKRSPMSMGIAAKSAARDNWDPLCRS